MAVGTSSRRESSLHVCVPSFTRKHPSSGGCESNQARCQPHAYQKRLLFPCVDAFHLREKRMRFPREDPTRLLVSMLRLPFPSFGSDPYSSCSFVVLFLFGSEMDARSTETHGLEIRPDGTCLRNETAETNRRSEPRSFPKGKGTKDTSTNRLVGCDIDRRERGERARTAMGCKTSR